MPRHEPTCRCDRPIHDMAYICGRCAVTLRHKIDDVARIAGDINVTVAKQAVVTAGIPRPDDLGWWKSPDALEPVPLPVDLDRAQRHDAAVMELATWARAIAEERGPQPRRWVGHPGRPPQRVHPLVELAATLADNLGWLRHQPFAEEAFDAISSACRELVRVVDTKPAGKLVCMCQCGERLYAQGHEETVTCHECGLSYEVAVARADLLDQGRELSVTPAEAADLIASWVDPNANRERVRNLIRQWAHRGLIEAEGDGLYRLGPILDRWTRALAARVA